MPTLIPIQNRPPRLTLAATVLAACFLSSGCASNNPVLQGDSEAIIALKNAGVLVSRIPTPGLPDMTGHAVDGRGIQINPEIAKHLGNVGSMVELKLTGDAVTDETLSAITACKHLQTVDLAGSAVTDAGLKHLAALTSLNSLSLADTRVTGAGLAGVPQVGILQLSNLPISDGDLVNLKHMKKLAVLVLSGTKVTAPGLAKLKQQRPNLLVVGIKQI